MSAMPEEAQREFDELQAKFEAWRRWFAVTSTFLNDGWELFLTELAAAAPGDKIAMVRLIARALQPTFDAAGPAPVFIGTAGAEAISPLLLEPVQPEGKPN